VNAWNFYNPVDLRFGGGVFDTLGEVIGGRRYLLVTHPDEIFVTLRERLAAQAGDPVAFADRVEPNPSLRMLETMCEQLAAVAGEVEVIIALGGGSVIDTAKFLAAGHLAFEPARAYLEGQGELDRAALPVIAVPTTAGTGSDLTKWATIWDPQTGRKLSLNRDDLFPEVALVDPALTHSLPWSLTLACGLDALSHALESNWNRSANPVTRQFARTAARDIMAALPLLKADLTNRSARHQLSRGATLAGLAFSNTMTALAHNISYPITLEKGLVHGIACSFSLPMVMQAAVGVDAECDATIAAIFDCPAEEAAGRLSGFLQALGVATEPSAYGIEDERWREIVTAAISGPRGRNFIGSLKNYPAWPERSRRCQLENAWSCRC